MRQFGDERGGIGAAGVILLLCPLDWVGSEIERSLIGSREMREARMSFFDSLWLGFRVEFCNSEIIS